MKYFNFIKKSAFLFFILLIIFFHGYAVYSGTIELFNGGFINFSKINLTRDTAVTDKKNIIQVSEIKKIEFIKNDITDTSINQISKQARNDSAAKNVIDDNFRLMEVKADVMKTKYQGVGAVIILDEGWQQIFPDGKHIYKYHFIGKIYNEDYLNWGVINLYYTE
ncbi:hypothetical protein KA977_11550, partial [Candidatus Dependentiae bacterium]|nr:hypothetical protein [Candidatus Dependentiae bacterium]